MIRIEDIVTDTVLEHAYAWMCRHRKDYPTDADCWTFRHRWPQEKDRLRTELLAGDYRISLLTRVTRRDGQVCDLWSARDAVVLKALALALTPRLPASPHCYHLPGGGGAKGAVRTVLSQLAQHTFVLKTDVKSYYASIDHLRLLDRLAAYITDQPVLNLIGLRGLGLWHLNSRGQALHFTEQ
jgi:hypothetical protein